MTEKHGYVYNRVLIDVDVALDSPFDDGVLWFSGAQIGMLRTVVRYLRRQHTFVEIYGDNYYIPPSTEDWDTISALVADLEDTLMGNPNTLWGYNDWYKEDLGGDTGPSGTYLEFGAYVPAGEVWVIQMVSLATSYPGATVHEIYVNDSVSTWRIAQGLTLAPDVPLVFSGAFSMGQGCRVGVLIGGLDEDDPVDALALGYKMKVPV